MMHRKEEQKLQKAILGCCCAYFSSDGTHYVAQTSPCCSAVSPFRDGRISSMHMKSPTARLQGIAVLPPTATRRVTRSVSVVSTGAQRFSINSVVYVEGLPSSNDLLCFTDSAVHTYLQYGAVKSVIGL